MVLLAFIFFKALIMFRVYIIIYRKTRKVKINNLIETKILPEIMGIAINFMQEGLF